MKLHKRSIPCLSIVKHSTIGSAELTPLRPTNSWWSIFEARRPEIKTKIIKDNNVIVSKTEYMYICYRRTETKVILNIHHDPRKRGCRPKLFVNNFGKS